MIKPKDGSCDLEIPKLQIPGEIQNIVGKYYAIFSLFFTFFLAICYLKLLEIKC